MTFHSKIYLLTDDGEADFTAKLSYKYELSKAREAAKSFIKNNFICSRLRIDIYENENYIESEIMTI